MQIQMVITALTLTALFAIPAQAVEDDESKKRRAAAKTAQPATVTAASATATAAPAPQSASVTKQTEDDRDCESIPASFFKKRDMSSF